MAGEAPPGAIAIAVCAKAPVGFDVNTVPAVAAYASDPAFGQSVCGWYTADGSWAHMYEFIYLLPGVSLGGSSDQPVMGGEAVGLDIGAAVFLVLAAAFGFRSLKRMLDSSAEG